MKKMEKMVDKMSKDALEPPQLHPIGENELPLETNLKTEGDQDVSFDQRGL